MAPRPRLPVDKTLKMFVGGKFIGGCDIVREMFETGELWPYLEVV